MDRFNADFRQLDALNIAKLAKPLSPPPARKKLNDTEANVLTSVSLFGEMLGVPAAGLITELSKIPKAPPAVTIATPKVVPFGFPSAAPKTLTFAIGGAVEAFGVVGASFQTGVYASNSPELGIFTSIGAGIFTGVGVSSGLALTAVFGPPSAFSGISTGIAVDVTIPGLSVLSGGAMLLFTAGPAFRFLGYSMGIATGFSGPLPVTISLQVSSTAIRPILK